MIRVAVSCTGKGLDVRLAFRQELVVKGELGRNGQILAYNDGIEKKVKKKKPE